MVKLGADLCLVFILDESAGSLHTEKLARKAGIETISIRRTSMAGAVARRVEGELKLENIRMIWRNFAGEERMFNEDGKRKFSIPLDEGLALELRALGWNVKDNSAKVALDPNRELLYHLEVNVKFNKRPPRIFMISKKWSHEEQKEVPVRTPLDEDTVALLDYAEFDNVDVILSPFNYNISGRQGVSAYLKTLFAIIHQDDLEKKYAHIPLEGADQAQLELENIIDAQVESDTDWVTDEDQGDEEQLALPRGRS